MSASKFHAPAHGAGPRFHPLRIADVRRETPDAISVAFEVPPVLSIMKTVLSREPRSRFFLFYGSRTTQEILFRGALEDLKDRHLGRVSVFHVLSQEQQDIETLNGRLEEAKLNHLLRGVLGGV